tara:strand:+ start:4216 stop:4698 length:483 start_codon:yes stop_codon:yes gene_type:complete
MQVYPKLVVFDLDFTLWDCGGKWIDCTDWPFRQEQDRVFDQSGNEFLLYAEVRELLDELQDADCRLALASRTTRPEWADWLLKAWDLDSWFAHQEIYPSSKIRHFEKLQADTNISFEEMIFFDDEERNIIEVAALGVTAVHVRNGLDRATFEEGLERHGS